MDSPHAPLDRPAVPDWRRETGSTPGRVPTLALAAAAFFLAYQAWLLPTLTDWRASVSSEGLLSYAAARVRAGEWPYRDFFFPGSAGGALVHALLQWLGLGWLGERAACLVAGFGSVGAAMSIAKAWRIPAVERALLAFLVFAWSFSLWNGADAAWYAVPLALYAVRVLPRSVGLAGALFAAASWFSFGVGVLGALGACLFLALVGERRGSARLGGTAALASLAPLAVAFVVAGPRALLQIFALPARAETALPAQAFAAPLTSLGLWMLSLFFLRADRESRSARLVQLGVVAYAGIYASRDPDAFLRAGFLLASFAAWPLSLALALTEKERSVGFFSVWLPGLGIFAASALRFDFPGLLFVFPLSALLLAHALARLHARYFWLPPLWARLPAIALLAGGVYLQVGVAQTRTRGSIDSLGRVSAGAGQRLDEEVTAVWRFLTGQGLEPGGPLLVLPNAPGVYRSTGFRDPTPHLQLLPGQLEIFGDKQSHVLPRYRAGGGRFVVVEDQGGLDVQFPEIWHELQTEYQEVKSFPEHFTVYAPRESPRGTKDGI